MGYSVSYCGDINVEPSLTEEDAATFLEIVNDKRTDRTKDFFDRVTASPEAQIPYSVGLLELSEDRSQILPETDESRAGAGTWLQLVVEHFLVPKLSKPTAAMALAFSCSSAAEPPWSI